MFDLLENLELFIFTGFPGAKHSTWNKQEKGNVQDDDCSNPWMLVKHMTCGERWKIKLKRCFMPNAGIYHTARITLDYII